MYSVNNDCMKLFACTRKLSYYKYKSGGAGDDDGSEDGSKSKSVKEIIMAGTRVESWQQIEEWYVDDYNMFMNCQWIKVACSRLVN